MGQAIVDLPDSLNLPVGDPTADPPLSAAELASADDLLSQLAGDDIDRLLAEAEGLPVGGRTETVPLESAEAKAAAAMMVLAEATAEATATADAEHATAITMPPATSPATSPPISPPISPPVSPNDPTSASPTADATISPSTPPPAAAVADISSELDATFASNLLTARQAQDASALQAMLEPLDPAPAVATDLPATAQPPHVQPPHAESPSIAPTVAPSITADSIAPPTTEDAPAPAADAAPALDGTGSLAEDPIAPAPVLEAGLNAELHAESHALLDLPDIELGPPSLLVRVLQWINKPVARCPDVIRDALGKVALLTLFNAIAVLVYVLVFRGRHPH